MSINLNALYAFIVQAAKHAYAGGGKYERVPERQGFAELVFSQDDWFYRDSFSGWYRSRGTEVVRYKDTPVWSSAYGGGVDKIDREFTAKIFSFLKQVLSVDNKGFLSFRGPENLRLGPWEYAYEQNGDIEEFEGYEIIKFQRQVVFSHRIIGGIIVDKVMGKELLGNGAA